MPTNSKNFKNQYWLIGVAKKKATLWWRLVYRKDCFGKTAVPEHLRQTGMYCPACRHGQAFGEQCSYCGCEFSCFVLMESNKLAGRKIVYVKAKLDAHRGYVRSLPKKEKKLHKNSQQSALIIAGLSLVLVLMIVTGVVQYRNYMQKQYTQNFIIALYGINSGMNLAGLVYEGKYKAWKDGTPEAFAGPVIVDEQTKADLEMVKTEIELVMQKIGKPSSEHVKVFSNLQQLHAIYGRLNSTLVGSHSVKNLNYAELSNARREYRVGLEALRASLPVGLATDIRNTGGKYDLGFLGLNN